MSTVEKVIFPFFLFASHIQLVFTTVLKGTTLNQLFTKDIFTTCIELRVTSIFRRCIPSKPNV